MHRILVPIRYAAWLQGSLGDQLVRSIQNALADMPNVRIERLPRALLVTAEEAPGPLLEAVQRASRDMDADAAEKFPVFHHEMGPVWTGTLQSLFSDPPAA